MKNFLYEGNQIHNFISSSGYGTVINYGSISDFLTSYGSGSTSKKVTVPMVPVPVPVPVPQHCNFGCSYFMFFVKSFPFKYLQFLCVYRQSG